MRNSGVWVCVDTYTVRAPVKYEGQVGQLEKRDGKEDREVRIALLRDVT